MDKNDVIKLYREILKELSPPRRSVNVGDLGEVILDSADMICESIPAALLTLALVLKRR